MNAKEKFSHLINSHLIKAGVLFTLVCLLPVVVFFSIFKGSVELSPKEILNAVFYLSEGPHHQIIWNIRLPRVLVGGAVGTCFALSGTILQGIMRNPLASPNIIGVSAGAGLAAVVIMILFPGYLYLVPPGAFLGALLASTLVYVLSWKGGVHPMRLVLAGVAVSSFFAAGTNALMIFYPDRVHGTVAFMVGGLAARSWPHFYQLLPYAVGGVLVTMFFANRLNILALGDEMATALGVNVTGSRTALIILASLLAAAAVSVVGLLGFVGLIVPHTARLLIGSDHRYLFPASALLGAIVVVGCDTAGRLFFRPVELPVGIIMAALGAPFFLYLLQKNLGRS